MLAVGRGGMDASFKLTRQEIAAAYDAGRDAVIALVEGLIERQEQRLAALEQELQELKQDSHDSGKPPSRDSFARKQLKQLKRSDGHHGGSAPTSASREDSRSIRVRRYGKRSNRIGSRSMPWSDAGVVGHWLTSR